MRGIKKEILDQGSRVVRAVGTVMLGIGEQNRVIGFGGNQRDHLPSESIRRKRKHISFGE